MVKNYGVSALKRRMKMKIYNESGKNYERRMNWWVKSRFGMLIHWGLYSVLGGIWKGKKTVFKYGEWIMNARKISRQEYSDIAKKFNPIKFNADEWVKIAKEAGMKYIVFTAKHHDGFCMFHSKLTNYNIVKATPFKRDVIAELSDSCRKRNIRFGIYYSQLDWYYSLRPTMFPIIPNFNNYKEYMKGQLKELLENYGPISVLFFDGDWMPQWNKKVDWEIENFCRELQPNLIINNRVGKRPPLSFLPIAYARTAHVGTPLISTLPFPKFLEITTTAGDYETPEQYIPRDIPNRNWETNMSMNNTYGYKTFDNNWKSSNVLIRKLIDIVSKNGNFLLNVGPNGKGEVPKPSIEILKEIGEWMELNSESIYDTSPGPINKINWVRSTQKDKKIFLHVFDYYNNEISIDGLKKTVRNVYILGDPKKIPIEFKQEDSTLFFKLPSKYQNLTPIVLEIEV